ncbi:hypothetical protein PENTCL1PPCAC_28660, partial [Pristionchus entomophagus]
TIWSTVKNTKWWTKYYIFIAVCAHLLCFIVHLTIRLPLGSVTRMYLDTRNVRYSVEEQGQDINGLVFKVQVGFGIFVLITCLFLNIMSLIFVRKLKKSNSSSTEKSLLLIGVCTLVTQLVNVSVTCAMALSHSSDYIRPTIVEIMTYTSDLFSLGPAVYVFFRIISTVFQVHDCASGTHSKMPCGEDQTRLCQETTVIPKQLCNSLLLIF